ncbi:hypothetical protein [uncultured Caulobacter sp.]|uniref:hypothetical protein n=1 Tax=uncultured Caulobacter sp. TaxID=158749 RepID=UPI002627717E|nr:hypothetical protein [uncultured Caulobacter sp.]
MAEIKERPILFSSPMVRAILEGQKTQTRRVVKPQPAPHESWDWSWPVLRPGVTPGTRICWRDDVRTPNLYPYCPYGKPGDRLWVRESHQRFDKGSCDQHVWYTAGLNDNAYVARTRPEIDRDAPWPREVPGPAGGAVYGVPSIHMPRWASRITLEIVSVRVERLTDITEDDAIAEGLEWVAPGKWAVDTSLAIIGDDPRAVYRELWEHINGPGSWAANPWVWVVTFNRVQP